MSAIGIDVKIVRGDDACPYGVKMDVTDKLLEVDVLLTDDRFVPVLKELTGSVVSVIERNGISRQKTSHELSDT